MVDPAALQRARIRLKYAERELRRFLTGADMQPADRQARTLRKLESDVEFAPAPLGPLS